jgi:predicted Rossmann fold nucleotide-binding protein DprA/Smf involved in DNA uptake
LEILGDGNPMDAAQIAAICGQSASDVSLRLLELEMDGLVRNISTNKYVHL